MPSKLKECENGNHCMKFGCKYYHKDKNKKDCIDGDLCYNIFCDKLHSRARNYMLFKKDLCYFGIKCNRQRLGLCNRFHLGIDKIPSSTYVLLKNIEKEEKKREKQYIKKEEKRKKQIKIKQQHKKETNYINIIENQKYIPINHLIKFNFTYSNGKYTYLTNNF